MPRVTPNDLRRSFATWLKQSDVDSAVVAAMMGHTSTAMVDRVYGRLDEGTLRRAIAKLPGASEAPTQAIETAPADCHARVTRLATDAGTHGTDGTVQDLRLVPDPDEESASYDEDGVRAEGLEPSRDDP